MFSGPHYMQDPMREALTKTDVALLLFFYIF